MKMRLIRHMNRSEAAISPLACRTLAEIECSPDWTDNISALLDEANMDIVNDEDSPQYFSEEPSSPMTELTCPFCGLIAEANAEPSIQYIDTVDSIRSFEGMKDGKPYFTSLSSTDYESSRDDRFFCQACLNEWSTPPDTISFDMD